jgi:hypothetical protein
LIFKLTDYPGLPLLDSDDVVVVLASALPAKAG